VHETKTNQAVGWFPQNSAERDQVREQLKRLLAHRLFQHSKRYGSLLQYIVEHCLEGKKDGFKERTIGVEVFGRDPDYDTNSDPVVRVTATELRKRLAQYYVAAQHEGELRIDLPVGSYVPEFHLPEQKSSPVRKSRTRYWPVFLLLAVILAGFAWWMKTRETNTAMDWFWKPVLDSHGDVLICVAPSRSFNPRQSVPERPLTLGDLHNFERYDVPMADLMALSRISGYLMSRGKRYDFRNSASARLTEFRERPTVLVGGFNNEWTMRLLPELRFSFEADSNLKVFSIKDNQNTARQWGVDFNLPYEKLTEDYGLISRVMSPTTEQMMVSVAGITGFGTVAAGEFLNSESNMQLLSKAAPPAWKGSNLQVVLKTRVIHGSRGPSHIVATAFW